MILLLILAIVAVIVFTNMALEVVGAVLGLLIILFAFIIRRRKQK